MLERNQRRPNFYWPGNLVQCSTFAEAVRFKSLAFEYQVVYLAALVRNYIDANIGIDGICTVFYRKAQGENASKLWVLNEKPLLMQAE